MKQGSDFVYVKVSTALLEQLGRWSRPVRVRIEESYNGDIELITQDVFSVSLRDLFKAEEAGQ